MPFAKLIGAMQLQEQSGASWYLVAIPAFIWKQIHSRNQIRAACVNEQPKKIYFLYLTFCYWIFNLKPFIQEEAAWHFFLEVCNWTLSFQFQNWTLSNTYSHKIHRRQILNLCTFLKFEVYIVPESFQITCHVTLNLGLKLTASMK